MYRMGAYDIVTRAQNPAKPWVNELIEDGIQGSIPSAEFFLTMIAELANAVEGSGLTLDSTDNHQLQKAILRYDRITENTTIYVPGNYTTLQGALQYLSTVRMANDVLVTVQVGAGDQIVNDLGLPLLIDHPYGDRIEVVGAALTGTGFPLPGEVDSADKTVVEALLRNRFPTRIKVTGTQKAVFQKSGTLRRIANILIIGDGSPTQDGFLIGQWQGAIGSGNIRFENVWAFNLGRDGFRSNYNSAIQGTNVGASHCGGNGFTSGNCCGIQIDGAFIAVRNVGNGVTVRDESFVEATTGAAAAFNRNGGSGVFSTETGSFQAMGATSIGAANNGSAGFSVNHASYAALPAVTTGGGNVVADVLVDAAAHAWVRLGTSLTFSPAANTVGNRNSIIVVGL